MALFRRSKSTETIPELEEYYATERRERSGVAWLLALASLVGTIVVVMAVFFGGRWLYRTIANKDKKDTASTTQVTSNQNSTKSTTDNSAPATTNPSTGTSSTSTNTPSNATTPSTSSSSSSTTSTPSQASTTTTQSANTTSTAPTKSTSATSAQVTNTGPGDTLLYATIAVIIGTIFHNYKLRRKTTNK